MLYITFTVIYFLCLLFVTTDGIDFTDFTSNADNKTQFIIGNSIEEVVQKSENASKTVFKRAL